MSTFLCRDTSFAIKILLIEDKFCGICKFGAIEEMVDESFHLFVT